MKKMRRFLAVIMIATLGISLSGCYGTFTMTKKVHKWNGTLSNKFVKEIVFLGLLIIPVYEVSTLIDAFILNTLEFWTGKNPMAFNQGNNEIEINGQKLIVQISDDNILISNSDGLVLNNLTFNNDESAWYSLMNGKRSKLLTVDENHIMLHTSRGEDVKLNITEMAQHSTYSFLTEYAAN